jgi:alpha-L-fucosidase 2
MSKNRKEQTGFIKSPPIRLWVAALCALWAPGAMAQASEDGEALANLDHYNVLWSSPSKDALGSMPLGNGDIGVNAWVEPSGDLVFYVSKTDAWDEIGRLCKIGRVRVTFDPPLSTNSFRQELKLRDGVIEIGGGDGEGQIAMRLWVDANQPFIHLEADSARPVQCKASVELWRRRERPCEPDEDGRTGGGLCRVKPPVTVLPDQVVTSKVPGVVWYHRNTHSIYPLALKAHHVESLQERFPDPLLHHTFGACLSGNDFIVDGPLAIKSKAPAKRHELSVTVLAQKAETPETFLAGLEKLAAPAQDLARARREHEAWWNGFWNRSWIFVGGFPKAETLNRAYVLQRFMSACSGRGGAPIKFNGSIFNVEKFIGADPETPAGNPDWRQWGGGIWFQNTRHSYWPMLAAGDFDMMQPLFRMYREALPLNQARIKAAYGFENAAQFPEITQFWGLTAPTFFGWNNKGPEAINGYIKYNWNVNLELIAVMLDRYDFTQDTEFARQTLVPLAAPLIAFLDQYYPQRDAAGKIRFEPAQAIETFFQVVNPMPEIAGLRFILPRLLGLPEELTSKDERSRWLRMLSQLPPVPTAEVNGEELLRKVGKKDDQIARHPLAKIRGEKLLRPAEIFGLPGNCENPELYAVFPYRLYGVGKPDLEMARRTYTARIFNSFNLCWSQDSIHAACLGLADEAGKLVIARAAVGNRHRFPAMWGPFMDWTPDQDHGGGILTTLQFMLMQFEGDSIFVLPGWPKGWDVSFKLHAPKRTILEGIYRGGKLEQLKVTPSERAKDVQAQEAGRP